ncbi:MAG: trypsin-like peptidase domain-containing protein [Candidatus Omnitrophica bacterium]|nr:trypsin-like peptidase domain-containing protein [Candidatus Omnitrophota bacterium]
MRRRQSVLRLLLGVAAALASHVTDASAYDRRTPVVEAVEKILPAVVNISTTKVVSVDRSLFPRSFSTPFDDLFGEMFQQKYRLEGLGSGVLIEGGYVVTNNHVISYEEYQLGPADKIYVNLYDEKEPREAILIGANPLADVAILKFKNEPPNYYLAWGRSDDLMIGETVIAAGSALGQPFTVTTGIISALNRTMNVSNGRHYTNLIQTNADINQGNSGGPLININGEFIGLNTMILSPSGGSVGLGFAIPVSRVRKIFDYWINHVISLEDQMGLQIQEIDPQIVHFFKNRYESLRDIELNGVLVRKVSLGGLSADYLNPLDIILEVNDRPIENSADFLNRLEEHQGGELKLKVIREGNVFPVRLSTPSRTVKMDVWMGMRLQSLDNPWREWFGINEKFSGLVVLEVEPDGEAGRIGIRRGDVLVNLDNEYDLYSLEDLHEAKKSMRRGNDVLLQFYRLVDKRWQPHRAQISN